ncbi:MAG: metallophosphoesterase [Synergistaceae bacterium]|jgi:hypothetical protein|nr:metallophosphoesterase [Synergistaceae bacterium]
MKILVIGDMHVGSLYGIAPRQKLQNEYQKWVIDKFEEMIQKNMDIDYLALVGDIIDGYGSKDSTDKWETNVDNQVSYAVQLLQPLLYTKKIKVIGVTGSGYHYGKGTGFDGDLQVTEKLHGEHNRSYYLLNTPAGTIYFHHSSKNPVTERKIIHQRYFHGQSKIAMLVGAHLHRYEHTDDGAIQIIHTPCFQYPTPFMRLGNAVSIGALNINIDSKLILPSPVIFPIPQEIEQKMGGYEGITKEIIQKSYEEETKLIAKAARMRVSQVRRVREIIDTECMSSMPGIKVSNKLKAPRSKYV